MPQGGKKRYTEDFKKQIVELYNTGTPARKLADEYGLIEQTIYKRIKLYSPLKMDGSDGISVKEYEALQKRISELELENEILKKATAIFARKP